jgi:hypothetical protein
VENGSRVTAPSANQSRIFSLFRVLPENYAYCAARATVRLRCPHFRTLHACAKAQAHWLAEYLHEMSSFPKGKFDDQVDSTSQALDWVKQGGVLSGILQWYQEKAEQIRNPNSSGSQTTYLSWYTRAFPCR